MALTKKIKKVQEKLINNLKGQKVREVKGKQWRKPIYRREGRRRKMKGM